MRFKNCTADAFDISIILGESKKIDTIRRFCIRHGKNFITNVKK